MYRAYFLIRKLKPLQRAVAQLEQSGIGHNRIHVHAKDPGMLDRAGLNSTTFWESTDIMPSGYRGAWLGFWAGVAMAVVWTSMEPFGLEPGIGAALAVVALMTCFGAWAGGLVGISKTQHDLGPYLGRIQNGAFLVLVDVDREHELERVRQALRHSGQDAAVSVSRNFSPLD